ncbi:MAG: glutamate 5-kinase [Actinomycetota bacterium]|jgi:glutamate 5-kinase
MMRIVVKIGTSSVTDEHGAINNHAIETLCNQVAQLREQSHEVLVVTSGAVAGGVAALRMSQRPSDTQTLQALAAVGQSQLMNRYNEYLSARGLIGAQVLLVPNDFIDRTQYLHARQTLGRLLELGCVPIINENDAIASDEIRFGDNDRIAALVAHSVGADALVLLTDIGGLYTADPRSDASATLVEQVGADDPLLSVNAGSAGTARGSGGMASKLSAARIASWSGVRTVIASASRANVLQDAIDQKAGVGTQFLPHNRNLSARKLWIAFAAQHVGSVVIDDGAKNALITRNTSLLHAGVVEVSGDFAAGDTVEIVDVRGVSFARGMVGIDAVQAGAAAGLQSSDLPEGVDPELVHRDDLVILLDK